ncbi:gastric inhibitory polypeptide receptor [Lepisosteus oculatus]|uniref:gastric inhibitory polypeptide receptor n=1 Tax=Lepisosteus oculatus TaxID=7918 RepID=UPI00371F6E52
MCGALAAFLLLTVSVLWRTEFASGKTMKDTVEEWNAYRNECLSKMRSDPSPQGLVCKRMFDMYACWTDGLPNTTVKVPCPWYLPWYEQVQSGFVLRECGPDGQWLTNNTSATWRDHSQCDWADSLQQEKQMVILAYFKVMYTVGYSLSLAGLTLAFTILLIFRKLRCTRNYIHTNLFASFILRAVSILTRDALLMREAREFGDNRDFVLSDQALSGCRVAQVLMQYCVGANYCWLLVEGLYLHNLLVLMVFSENSYFCGYLVIGWGTPVLFVVPWTVVRYLYENKKCWEMNENMAYWWIIRSPILFSILINFFIFIRIIKILVSKLTAHQMRYTDYKFRLAKSTLTLIPLLGIHEVVFAFITEEQAAGTLRNVKLFFELFFNSFQGLLVAVLYCFVNKEVQSEIKKKWQRWKLGMSLLEEYRLTCSNMPQGGTGNSTGRCHCHLKPPGQGAAHCNAGCTCSSDSSSCNQHLHPSAKKGKSYCYFSAHKQAPSNLNCSPQDNGGEGVLAMYTESYC